MDLKGFRIAVIGAGIGGLAVARTFALRGADVTVLEQAGEIAEVGAGLQISPNGLAVLRALGLEDEVAARSGVAREVVLHDYRRGPVLRLDLAAGAGAFHLFHRADLVDMLHDAATEAGARILLLQKVRDVTPGPSPSLRLVSGADIKADLIIGADGLHSVARAKLNGTSAPFFTRQVAWRALVPNTTGRVDDIRLHMGPHRHLVSYPLRDASLINVVAVQERAAWSAESWSQRDDPMALRAAFADFGGEAQALLGAVEDVHLWGLFRHPVARVWGQGGVALMGDAAHPTLPFLAQGANLALEDAWVLADAVSRAQDVEAALADYQARRADRTARVVQAASRNAWKYHLSFPPLRWAAHTGLRVLGATAPGRFLGAYDWIYRQDVTQE